jgi:hypothetical protein
LEGELRHFSPQRNYWVWLGLPTQDNYFRKLKGICVNLTNRISYDRKLLSHLLAEKRRQEIQRALLERQMAAQQAAKAAEDSRGKVTPEGLAEIINSNNRFVADFCKGLGIKYTQGHHRLFKKRGNAGTGEAGPGGHKRRLRP